MSDFRSPLYFEAEKIQAFAAIPVSAMKPLSKKQPAGPTPQEELEEHRRLAIEAGEKMGRERGHAKGFLEGYEQGKEIGAREAKREADLRLNDELADFSGELQRISDQIQLRIAEWFESSETQMAELAMEAVKKLVCAELAISRDSAIAVVKDALREVTHSRHARIRVNPFDAPVLRDRKQEILAATGNLRDVEFVSDSSISGGCVIETEGGVVDSTLDTKLILLENELKKAS